MSNTNRIYLLISGRLYSAHRQANDKANTACNLYPCAMGTFTGHPVDLPPGTRHAVHGDTVDLFGRRYQVNDLRQGAREFAEDEIDLELVLLGADPDAALLAAPAPAALEPNPDFPALVADVAEFAAAMTFLAETYTGNGGDPNMLPPSYRSCMDTGTPDFARLAARGRMALERLAAAV